VKTVKNNEWSGDTIKDFKNRNSYDAFIKMGADGKLTATGFVVFHWLSESISFARYKGKLPVQD
jgi:hypothetical protein